MDKYGGSTVVELGWRLLLYGKIEMMVVGRGVDGCGGSG